jgi:anti-sigma B factor antagonist
MKRKLEVHMLNIRVERRGKIAVLFCDGRIDIGEPLTRLREAVLYELGGSAVVLDLAQVTAIDAAGLGLLMFLHTRAAGRGCELKISSPSAQVAGVLKITKLDSVLSTCSPEEIEHFRGDAVASLRDHHDADCVVCRAE